ncbi:SIR2 family protein [Salipiger abyssi]|uniref:SIR2 family protein n=1 Tax=Salipiger abyssi TaxID=1250539 RepID=UPI00097748DD|nr:SIR2 family protein [Salipiger abyssi]
MALEKNQIPTELFDAYREGKCGVFVGAGLSQGAGLPDWAGLLVSLIDKAESDYSIPKEKADDCRKLAEDPAKFLMLAQEMKEVLGVEFKSVIEDVFGRADLQPTQAHELLVSLKGNRFIITTNYDMLIEQAFAKNEQYRQGYKYYEAHALQRDLYKRAFFILKAHGDAKTAPEHIILTDKDYRRILYKEPGYQSALQSIFTMYSVIFLGSSLKDPDLQLLLNYINAAFPEGGIPHYALMTTDEIGNTERGRWKKDYNMRIIPISSEDNYEDINRFLRFLQEEDPKQQ